MYNRVNYTLVGLFVLLLSVGLILFTLWLGKYGFEKEYNLYRIVIQESIVGLSKDSRVKLRGVDIGRVRSIGIDPRDIESVEVIIEIDASIPIKEDMYASTVMMGVTGLLSIEILGGSNGAKMREAQNGVLATIPYRSSLLSSLAQRVEGMSATLDTILLQVAKLLSNENIGRVSAILEKMEALESQAIALIDEANSTLLAITNDFHTIKEDFGAIQAVGVPTIEKLMQTSKNFNRVTLKVERSLDRGDYNLKRILEPLLVDMEILAQQLGGVSQELQRSPSDFLFGSRAKRKGPGE
jgi:phospholipid/cholesterol/gamma-HCH transport system substrate-binding protein